MRRFGTPAAVLLSALGGMALLTAACTASPPAGSAQLTVAPGTSRADEALTLGLQGVASGTPVTVRVSADDAEPVTFTAQASFTVGDGGALAGDAAQLVSVMQPPAGSTGATGGGFVWPVGEATFTWTVTGADGQQLATATSQRSLGPAGGRQVTLAQDKDGIVGSYAAVPDGARHPAVLVVGGSEGGNVVSAFQAAALAARGIPALGQAYFKAPGLPDALTQIPMETFDKGLEWLRAQPEVDPARVWVLGGSYGSEAALLEGSRRPDLVHGVVATSPSNAVTVSAPANGRSPWTVGGQDVPFTVLFGKPDAGDNPSAIIPVEKIGGPVLAVCGEGDTLWPSCPYAQAIMSRLDTKGFAHPHEVYAYPQAGHYIDLLLPYQPRRADLFAHGVSAEADELARADVWPKVVQAVTTS